MARAVGEVLAALGALDAVVNNAGITGATSGPLETLSLAEWNRRIGANLTGVFLMAKHCAPPLRKAHGAIVNVASTRALQSEPHTEAYSAANRITSYNVCYTKLLRTSEKNKQEGTTSAAPNPACTRYKTLYSQNSDDKNAAISEIARNVV